MEQKKDLLQALFLKWQSATGADQRAWIWGVIASVGAFLVWRYSRLHSSSHADSFFRNREFERSKVPGRLQSDLPGQKKTEKKSRSDKPRPLLLEGLRLQGAPHEVLGVSPHATQREIQKAFRSQILRYHPDQMPPEYQKEAAQIVDALTRARDALLQKDQS